MKTNEIQKNLRGDYVVRIQTINHGVIKDFVFYNLSEAINFANRLTFEEFEKMNENKDKNKENKWRRAKSLEEIVSADIML